MDAELNTLIANLNTVNENDAPQWALIIIQSVKGLFTVIKSFSELTSRLNDIKSVCENNSTLLFQENQRLKTKLEDLENRIEDQEQRSRNTCLLIHGIDEVENENTDDAAINVFKNDLGLNFDVTKIQRSHRVGPKKKNPGRNTRTNKAYPRPIIVKFVSYRDRRDVYSSKKKLKGKRVAISENLTQKNYVLFKQAQEKLGRNYVWTNDGRITTKVENTYINIRTVDDLLNLDGMNGN